MDIKEHQLLPTPRELNVTGNENEIYLSIEIGNGQIGGSKVTLGDKLLAKGNLANKTFLAKAVTLNDKVIQVETNVLDVNSFTNTCVITTKFYNQHNELIFSKIDKGEAPDGGIASFKGNYLLKLLMLLLVFAFSTTLSSAQKKANEIKFQDLETPSSPGFILLDKTPSSIQRPTTPQGFGVNVIGILQGTGGAMEVAPFWLLSHPKLTAEMMFENKFPILYNFSISVASTKSDEMNYLAGGIRTRLFQFYPESKTTKLKAVKGELENALADLDLKKIEELQKQYAALIEKPVFTIDMAAALAGGSTTNSFDNLTLNRWAAWLSFNFRPKGDDFYITALTRYINNEKFEDYNINANLIDLGTRLNYDINKFCISLEYLQRLNVTAKKYSDFRLAAVGSYQISENFYITSTFGKNFSGTNNIIALAGINFGFSSSKIKAY
ncbi:hypothetical protein [Nubsella zeaxanthinifaciens]|uniref:hypothetical protein n=1 Tax=Nubsella zeaxanthinifaciens TaxID=392412 RepID=UPI000DE51E41|nr:hypothetical protein [Nubsella zeaxanthinifaciens]